MAKITGMAKMAELAEENEVGRKCCKKIEVRPGLAELVFFCGSLSTARSSSLVITHFTIGCVIALQAACNGILITIIG